MDTTKLRLGEVVAGASAILLFIVMFFHWYGIKTGFSSQMTEHDLDPNRHDNLFEPVDEDRGAHGPFDDKAHSVSAQYELSKRRGLVFVGLGAAAAGAAAAALRNGN